MMGIPIIGKKFYRDRMNSGQAVIELMKDVEEKRALVKKSTYYLPSSIKLLWRFVLRVIIKYIFLDTRFNCLCMNHFVLLNHFRYDAKISIPFFLYSSINENINDYKEKPISNPTFHEGLLLLIYEFFKDHTIGKGIKSLEEGNDESKDSREDYIPSDTEDRKDMHLGKEGVEIQQMKKGKNRVKKQKNESPIIKQYIKISYDRYYNEKEEGIEIEDESAREEKNTNIKEGGHMAKKEGKKKITIKMSDQKVEGYSGKGYRRSKR